MVTKHGLMCMLMAIACVVTCGCQSSNSPPRVDDAPKTSTVDRVTAGTPTRKTLQLFTEQPGKVVAYEDAPVLSKLPGYVEAVLVDIGDKVTKGQTLIRIHAPEYQDQVEQKRGLLGQAEAQVKQAEATVVACEAAANSAKAQVAQMEANVGRSEAEVVRWSSENQRMQQLASKGTITPKLAEEVSSQLKSAEAAKKEVQASIESARAKQLEAEANVLKARTDVEAAKAKLRVAQSDIAQAETMLKYTELKAPFDGFITARHVDTGHYVQPAGANNLQSLLNVSNLQTVRVFVDVPENEAIYVSDKSNQGGSADQATITSPNLSSAIQAQVTRTSLQLDSQSRALRVEIDLDNPEAKLRPGLYVNVKILLEQRDNVLSLPLAAVVKKGSEAYCCLVSGGKIVHQPIELGLRVGDDVEIKSGLVGNETVVLLRAAAFQPDQPVEIITKK